MTLPTSALILRILLAASVAALGPIAAAAAIFDDGNERRPINDLRKTDPATRSSEESAILEASVKTGSIGFCGGKLGGNALLASFRGMDVIVTNAHMFADKHGTLECEFGALSGRNSTVYMPNTSYYDPDVPNRNRDFVMRKVELLWPPLNWDLIKAGYGSWENDFALFLPTEPLSDDSMVDGTKRGALDFSTLPIAGDRLFMIGLAKDVGEGRVALYQMTCRMFEQVGTFYHGCDTLKGSSASLLATIEGPNLTFRGLHSSGTEDVDRDDKYITIMPNIGTSSAHVLHFLEGWASDRARPFMTYEIQRFLLNSGCYSGKLDNRWGPGSQLALANIRSATGVSLSSNEPSIELLAEVSKLVSTDGKICQ